MSRKYVFNTENYFKAPVEKLIPDKEIIFPLFLYFKRNDHLILRHLSGHAFTENDILKLQERAIDSFWCPIDYRDAWIEYLNGKDAVEAASSQEEAVEETLTPSQDPEELTPIEELAVEIMENEHVTPDQKKEVLQRISSQMVGLLASTTSTDEKEVEEAFSKCREFSDAIVSIATQSHKMSNVYDEIMMINDSKLSHSTAVSTLSSLFAMGLGYVDNESLTDIALGALLHDVGVIRMDPRLLIIPENSYNEEELSEFREHVSVGLDIIQKNYIEMTDVVQTVIEQHHERFDGKGFPQGLSGVAINELAQVVAIADYVDDLMTGRSDGKKRSPADALAYLSRVREESTPGNQPFHPEILTSIIQHIEKGRERAIANPDEITSTAIQKQTESLKQETVL